jgi:2-keto-3-deoxy-L-rhamnonate aldolase RhmA
MFLVKMGEIRRANAAARSTHIFSIFKSPMELDFETRLKRREVLLGPIVTLGSTEVAEILSKVGFDWLWIEMEHAPNGLARVQEMIQAAGGRVPCLVRAPWNDAVGSSVSWTPAVMAS